MTSFKDFLKDVTRRPTMIIVYVILIAIYTIISRMFFDLSIVNIIAIDFVLTVTYVIAAYNIYDDGYDNRAYIPGHLLTLVTAMIVILALCFLFKFELTFIALIEFSVFLWYFISAKLLYIITEPDDEE